MHPRPLRGVRVDPGHPLATVAPMAGESIEDRNRQVPESKCSVLGCGAQAIGWVEEADLNFDGDLSNPIVEWSFRCQLHMENTGPGPHS